jgi:hypothetical protein
MGCSMQVTLTWSCIQLSTEHPPLGICVILETDPYPHTHGYVAHTTCMLAYASTKSQLTMFVHLKWMIKKVLNTCQVTFPWAVTCIMERVFSSLFVTLWQINHFQITWDRAEDKIGPVLRWTVTVPSATSRPLTVSPDGNAGLNDNP